ncbi:MAG: replication restart helicase PriA [Gemmatimonadota bacterium]
MLVEVALPAPVFHTFIYEIAGDELPAPGSRAIVPFRNREVVGIVLGEATQPAPDRRLRLRRVVAIPDERPALTPALLRTARWCSEHYATPLGVVLRAALPAALGATASRSLPARTHQVVELARRIETLLERDETFRRTPRQREVYEYLEGLPGSSAVPLSHVESQLGVSGALLGAMARRGLVRVSREAILRDPLSSRPPDPRASHRPTSAQQGAIEQLLSMAPGSVGLLHGITGSGKTLVYIEILRRALAVPGAGAIVLVPEIALTPQTVDRFRNAFGDAVTVMHSALGEGERLDAWRALRSGERRVVVGPRSVVFAPLPSVGAIIVDEEHEASYKQGEAPRYNARDVAIIRARHEGAITILGSATPSLESWKNAADGRYQLVTLNERAGAGRLPSVHLVDLRQPLPAAQQSEVARTATTVATIRNFRRVFSEPLEAAINDRLRQHEQTVLLLNRRGYASFLQCRACGDVVVCPDCAVTLTLHRSPERLACHYCNRVQPPGELCARCNEPTLKQRGLGTQQVERLLSERFPEARIARMDVDTTVGKWSHVEILDRVASGETDILLGTQMIAKGLDFPNVTLVGVVDADVSMNLPDFRAAERTFQLIAQVAGRAGRGEKSGEVFIQTRLPGHHAIRCAVTHDYVAFARQELSARQSPLYPPVNRIANIIVSGVDEYAVEAGAQSLARWLASLIELRSVGGLEVVGPAPAPVERIRQQWRWRMLIKSTNSRGLSQVLSYLATHSPLGREVRLVIDRDPQNLL